MKLDVLIVTFALGIGAFMNVLDSTIVNVSLSHIAGDFGVAPSQGTWVITSYAVSEAIILPMIGWLTLKFGNVKQYVWSTLLFTVASVLCGMSTNYEMLIAARVLQGIVGASMIPLSQSLMLAYYPKEKRNVALSIWALTVIVAPILGPIIGGYVTDNFSWRWAFYINIPFGLISSYTIHMIYKKAGHVDKTSNPKFDYVGFVLLVIGVGCLQLMLDMGNDEDWFASKLIITFGILAFVSLVTLVMYEWHHPTPMVNVRLFAKRNFAIGSFGLMFAMILFFSSSVCIPIWLQNMMGYTSYASGLTTATSGLAIIIVAPILGKNLHKFDVRKVIILGFLLTGLINLFHGRFSPDVTQNYLALNRFIVGAAMAFFFLPLNSLTLSDVEQENLAGASGVYNFMRNLGVSVATSVGVNFWTSRSIMHRQDLVQSINIGNQNFADFGSGLIPDITSKLALVEGIITKQAYLMGMNDMMLYSALGSFLIIFFIMLAKKPTKIVQGGH